MARKRIQSDVAGKPALAGEQPGLVRKMLKLRPETAELLQQVSAFRGEKYLDCVHNLLVEEVRRTSAKMKERIDHLATLRTDGHD